jgi:ankyrin repeat protein
MGGDGSIAFADWPLKEASVQTELSPLMQAMYTGRVDEVQRLVSELGSDGLTVHEAAAVGDVARLAQLIGTDATVVNAWSTDGFQPLGLAAFFGRLQAVELLLAHGAEVNTQARNPMRVAALHAALAGSDHEIARPLIAAGADVNARQQGGVTPLQEAAMNGKPDLCRLLLEHGADLSARDDEGRTAADLARKQGHAPVLEVLEGR